MRLKPALASQKQSYLLEKGVNRIRYQCFYNLFQFRYKSILLLSLEGNDREPFMRDDELQNSRPQRNFLYKRFYNLRKKLEDRRIRTKIQRTQIQLSKF